jgi:hypothetical protein
MTTYALEKRLYEAANRAAFLGAYSLETELLSIADAVGELEYRLDSLDR